MKVHPQAILLNDAKSDCLSYRYHAPQPAYATRGICQDLLRPILAEHELLTGKVNLAELRRVLRDRLKAGGELIAQIDIGLRDQAIVPKPDAPSDLNFRDLDDRWVLASAVAGGADMLVTGDHDLPSVAAVSPVPIVSPRACWERLRRAG